MVENGICEEGGGFDGVGEVAAEFPGHDAVYGCEAGCCDFFWSYGRGGGGGCGLEAFGRVELGADVEKVGGMAPGGYGVFRHGLFIFLS